MIEAIRGWWEYRSDTRHYRLWNLPFLPIVPYPTRAARLSVDINLTGCWWRPSLTYRRGLSEAARADGETLWWARWLFFQISYGRFL